MSTRGCIARGSIDEKGKVHFEGVYNHFDSYPTNLGKSIWDIMQKQFIKNRGDLGVANDGSTAVESFSRIYIDGHPGGWSSFPEKCYCHDPAFVMRDGNRAFKITDREPDPLFVEWVYIIDSNAKKLHILEHKSADGDEKGGMHIKPLPRKKPALGSDVLPRENITRTVKGIRMVDYGHCVYYHELVGSYDFYGKEPNWSKIAGEEE